MTRTTADEKIARLLARHGHAGYGLFWMALESVAEKMTQGSQDCSLTLPRQEWASRLRLYPNRVTSALRSLADLRLISLSSVGGELKVSIPNLLKYRDEWQQRLGKDSRATPEKLTPKTTESEIRIRVNSETEKDNTHGDCSYVCFERDTQNVEITSIDLDGDKDLGAVNSTPLDSREKEPAPPGEPPILRANGRGRSKMPGATPTPYLTAESPTPAPQPQPAKPKPPALRPEVLLELWERWHGDLPGLRAFSPERRRKAQARLQAHAATLGQFLEDFGQAVRKAASTPFLLGENDRGWRATFDWLLANNTNYLAVLEGKYDRAIGQVNSGGAGVVSRNLRAAVEAIRRDRG
jgi:hypothetical protein